MMTLNILKELAISENKKRFPSLPDYARVAPKYNDKNANGLTRCIIDYIRLNGGQAERVSVTGRLIDKRKQYTDVVGRTRVIGSTQWIRPSMQPGTADISATINGKSVKIEVKVGKDKQRPAQAEYQKQVETAGGIYLIISSFDEFYDWFQKRREAANA